MRRNSRILVLWMGIIFIWTSCLLMTCLLLSDTMCLEEEICDHVDDVNLLGMGRFASRYKEIYENIASVDEIDDYIRPRSSHKTILLYKNASWHVAEGDHVFRRLSCPTVTCSVTYDAAVQEVADVVVLDAADVQSRDDVPSWKPAGQLWLLYTTQPPDLLQTNLSVLNGLVNWTATYSSESDIPLPFGVYKRLRPFAYDRNGSRPARSDSNRQRHRKPRRQLPTDQNRTRLSATGTAAGDAWNSSVLSGKSRLIAMFTDSRRLQTQHKQYVHEIRKHVLVDIYDVSKPKSCGTQQQCLAMLRTKYKFYLAFEESSCRQYISDRFWRIALAHDVVPVVMGPPRFDYEQVAPPNSFIHVADFESPARLAAYLGRLAGNASLYEQYFLWKYQGYVEYGDGRTPGDRPGLWCQLCTTLHERKPPRSAQVYQHLDKWWSARSQCGA